jgi:hypothetical protein
MGGEEKQREAPRVATKEQMDTLLKFLDFLYKNNGRFEFKLTTQGREHTWDFSLKDGTIKIDKYGAIEIKLKGRIKSATREELIIKISTNGELYIPTAQFKPKIEFLGMGVVSKAEIVGFNRQGYKITDPTIRKIKDNIGDQTGPVDLKLLPFVPARAASPAFLQLEGQIVNVKIDRNFNIQPINIQPPSAAQTTQPPPQTTQTPQKQRGLDSEEYYREISRELAQYLTDPNYNGKYRTYFNQNLPNLKGALQGVDEEVLENLLFVTLVVAGTGPVGMKAVKGIVENLRNNQEIRDNPAKILEEWKRIIYDQTQPLFGTAAELYGHYFISLFAYYNNPNNTLGSAGEILGMARDARTEWGIGAVKEAMDKLREKLRPQERERIGPGGTPPVTPPAEGQGQKEQPTQTQPPTQQTETSNKNGGGNELPTIPHPQQNQNDEDVDGEDED